MELETIQLKSSVLRRIIRDVQHEFDDMFEIFDLDITSEVDDLEFDISYFDENDPFFVNNESVDIKRGKASQSVVNSPKP